MNPQQRLTLKRLAIAGVATVGLLGAYILIEIAALMQGGDSTISRLMWEAWAKEPWVVFLASHLIAAPIWFLGGHFFAQRRAWYDEIRRGKR